MNTVVKCTVLSGRNEFNEVLCVFHGRHQIEIQDSLLEDQMKCVEAIRINGEVFAKVTDNAFRGELDFEWSSGTPSWNARPSQEAEIRRREPKTLFIR